MSALESGLQGLTRWPSRSAATRTFFTEVFDNEVIISALASIAQILRVANEIETERPRIAYLCWFYAFEEAHRLDPGSSGRGLLRQFKTVLLQRLERGKVGSGFDVSSAVYGSHRYVRFSPEVLSSAQVAMKGTPLHEVILEILKGKWDHERTKFSLPPLMTLVQASWIICSFGRGANSCTTSCSSQ